MDLLKGFNHLTHASIRFERDKVIYVDPFKIDGAPKDADVIFCTHDHFDHLSPGDIKKVMKPGAILVVPKKKAKKFKKYEFSEVIGVEPFNEYEAQGIKFRTIPSYNLDKKFHKKKKNWVGYIIDVDKASYYFAGDTDYIPEMDEIEADVVFLPVGGTYTMNAEEAAKAANSIKPKMAVPIHFGTVVGTREDAETFAKNLDKGIQSKILLES